MILKAILLIKLHLYYLAALAKTTFSINLLKEILSAEDLLVTNLDKIVAGEAGEAKISFMKYAVLSVKNNSLNRQVIEGMLFEAIN